MTDAATNLLTQALGINTPAAAEVAQVADPPAAAPEAPAPASPPEPQTPEGEPDTLAALKALGLSADKLAEAQKLINDTKSKKGRELAERARQLEAENSALKAKADKADTYEEQFAPILNSLKPPAPAYDPVKEHPDYKRAVAEGYNQEQIDLVLAPRIRLQLELDALKSQRAQEEATAKGSAYISSIMDGDETHPVPWKEVEPLIGDTLKAHPGIDAIGKRMADAGATPEALIDFLYGQIVALNYGKFAAKAAAPPAAPAPGKATAAPIRGVAPAAPTSTNDPGMAAQAFLEASRLAK